MLTPVNSLDRAGSAIAICAFKVLGGPTGSALAVGWFELNLRIEVGFFLDLLLHAVGQG